MEEEQSLKKYFTLKETKLTSNEAYQLLKNFDSNLHLHTDTIKNPKIGELYIFYSNDEQFKSISRNKNIQTIYFQMIGINNYLNTVLTFLTEFSTQISGVTSIQHHMFRQISESLVPYRQIFANFNYLVDKIILKINRSPF